MRVFDLTPERTAVLRAELERIFEGAGAEDLTAPPSAEEPEAEPEAEPGAGSEEGTPESQVEPA